MAFTIFARKVKLRQMWSFDFWQIQANMNKCGICRIFAIYLPYVKIRFFVQCLSLLDAVLLLLAKSRGGGGG